MLAVVLLVAVAPLVVGLAGAASAGAQANIATNETADAAVDVVIVFDRSDSTNEDRYHMAQEVDRLANRFDDAGIHARYGLVTYNENNRVDQPLTSDFDSFEKAMHFTEGGNVEKASDAILTATSMDFRDNAETVVVVVTDEDDDSSNATRDAALSSLSGVHFIAVSPSSPHESSCAVHTPPCDDRSDNELRVMADQVGGDWIDQDQSAADIVDGIADVVESTVDTGTGSGSERSSTPSAEFETTDRSTNPTIAEVGDLVRFSKTVENVGTADGTYRAYLSHDGTIVTERTISIPAGDSRNITFVHRFEDPGEYEMLISHEPVGTVTVTEPHNVSIDVAPRPDGTGLTVTVADAWANGTVKIPVTDAGIVPDDVATIENVVVSIGAVNVTPAHDVAFDLEVLANDTPPNGADPLPEHVANVRYLTFESSLGTDLAGVQFEYQPAAEETTLYRYDDANATWVPLDGTVNASESTSPMETVYAIGVRQPSMSVTGLTVDPATITVGETAVVDVTVENEGVEGTFTVRLRLNGSVVGVQEVSIPADGVRTVEFTVAPDSPGRYNLGVHTGPSTTLQVDAAPALTPSPTQSATESPTPSQGSTSTQMPGFGFVVAIGALAIVALLAYRRG